MRSFIIKENGLAITFGIRNDLVVELLDFSTEAESRQALSLPDAPHPVMEVQITGTSTRAMHGYKHNMEGASLDFHYDRHNFHEYDNGRELLIHMKTDYQLEAVYHMRFYNGVSVVRTWAELTNKGTEDVGLEYVSSFIYQGLCGNGKKPYYDKTDIYVPNNSWASEAQWVQHDSADLNLSGMTVDGFNLPGFGNNRFWYGSSSSWSTCEYLPMGFAANRETGEIYCFEIESSGQWHAEYGSGDGKCLYLALSGPTEREHGWWKNLKPGKTFTTVPAAFGVVKGGVSEATAVLTEYRRAIRRKNPDDEKLNVVFNDYMNCLMGDPTEEKEHAIMKKAADLGCEYYCLDCGWYDDGFWWNRVGEWKESAKRFPNGLKSVCDFAKSLGMKMGLWLEIEVMGITCPLAADLPDDWFICRHGKRHKDNGRYLLDFRNPNVRAYCRGVVDRLIRHYGVEYFKVDYNVTMGFGSDLHSDSCSDAILEHYRYLHQWYENLFRDYPDLVIENCGSGAQRMDYGMLRLLSLQSTSDQTDAVHNAYIAANVASAVTPEQAGMWVFPYKTDEEHVIWNMVNGLLLRPYISGMVWDMDDTALGLMKEGITLYKSIRGHIRSGAPFFPLGFGHVRDDVLAYGICDKDIAYLSVFAPKTDYAEIPLPENMNNADVSVLYPSDGRCEYFCEEGVLKIRFPQKTAARLFQLNLNPEA